MLVDDFLDSSKLRARTLRVDRRAHEIIEIIEPIRPLIAKRAAMKHVRVVEQMDDELPEVFADVEKARRVLVNLVVNAIKFSPEGEEVTIAAAVKDGSVEISVTDRGPGIPDADLARIFERFQQGGTESHRSMGFGLGLSIASDLARLNLGTIGVRSEPGVGSTFFFTLLPADLATVLRSYLQSHAEADPTTPISAMVARPVDRPEDLQSLRAFLCSECHPTDLVLMLEKGILLVGLTAEPDRWATRLNGLRATYAAQGGESTTGDFGIDLIGTWLADEAEEPVLGCLECSSEALTHEALTHA
jgi:hypothetical protein